jgi:hypothetical protein
MQYLQDLDLNLLSRGQSSFSGSNIVFNPNTARYLPDRHVVLPGKDIFKIFIEGTTINIDDKDNIGKTVKADIKANWH